MIFVNCCDKEQQGQVSCCGHLAILGKPAEVEGFVGSFRVDAVSFFLNSCGMDIPWTLQILAMNQLFHPCTTSLCFPHAESMPAVFHSFSAQTRLSYGLFTGAAAWRGTNIAGPKDHVLWHPADVKPGFPHTSRFGDTWLFNRSVGFCRAGEAKV